MGTDLDLKIEIEEFVNTIDSIDMLKKLKVYANKLRAEAPLVSTV